MTRREKYEKKIKADFRWGKIQEEAGKEGTVFLGSVLRLTPSGKIYAPFANSNVADCKQCQGTGYMRNRKVNLIVHEESKAKRVLLTAENIYNHVGFANWPETAKTEALRLDAAIAATAPIQSCGWCGGLGSHEAAQDEDWNEALEAVAGSFGLAVEHDSGDIFLSFPSEDQHEIEDCG